MRFPFRKHTILREWWVTEKIVASSSMLLRTSTHSCICIAYFCDSGKSRRACLSSCTSCRARTTIQVSQRATNDGIINITLPEPRTQPRTNRVRNGSRLQSRRVMHRAAWLSHGLPERHNAPRRMGTLILCRVLTYVFCEDFPTVDGSNTNRPQESLGW